MARNGMNRLVVAAATVMVSVVCFAVLSGAQCALRPTARTEGGGSGAMPFAVYEFDGPSEVSLLTASEGIQIRALTPMLGEPFRVASAGASIELTVFGWFVGAEHEPYDGSPCRLVWLCP